MPKALAIETSGRTGSVALVEDGRVVADETFSHGLQHAAEIVVRIDRLCRERNWRPTDIDEVYVSAGPGSFTGLRIGVTLAKTLAFATGAKLVAVPTVQVLAQNAPPEARHVVIVLDAKRDQIFTARLARSGAGWVCEEGPILDTLQAILSRTPRPVYLIGEGIPRHEKFLASHDDGVIVTSPATWTARAAEVAKLGWEAARAGEFIEPDRLTPIYIRRPEAEEKLDAKLG